MKKMFVVMLSIMLLFTSISISSADSNTSTDEAVPVYRFIGLYLANTKLSISNGIANCTCVARAKTSDYSLSVTLTLQKKSGANWNNIISWSGTGNGFTGVVLNKTKSGLSSGTYRCKAYVRVYDSNGIFVESTNVYSQSCSN